MCAASYDGTCEDLFFYVERLIAQACGDEVAGRLHTARSRNDIDMTMYRMRQRELILALAGGEPRAARVAARAGRPPPRDGLRRAHAHAARAADDGRALPARRRSSSWSATPAGCSGAYERTNRSPLGACAITGTGFPIDRHLTAALLGFDGPTGNTYGSIATVDYLLESVVGGRRCCWPDSAAFVQDLLLWSTAEFDYLRLGDGFVQSSSIMPQKRNPVALEHARAIGSKALGQAQAIVAERPQHAVRRHRRHRRRSAAARVLDVPRRHPRRDARRGGDADRGVRRRAGSRPGRATGGRR